MLWRDLGSVKSTGPNMCSCFCSQLFPASIPTASGLAPSCQTQHQVLHHYPPLCGPYPQAPAALAPAALSHHPQTLAATILSTGLSPPAVQEALKVLGLLWLLAVTTAIT